MSKSLYEAAKSVMTLEEQMFSPKLNSLIQAGLVESKEKTHFTNAYKKLRMGGPETRLSEQERNVMKSLVVKLLEMVDEAPEFFNIVRKELTKK